MSDSKLDKAEAASVLTGLIAGLGAVLGVTSVNVRAAEPPTTGATVQQNLPAAAARQDKGVPASAMARQGKLAPVGAPIMSRGLPNADATQARPLVATGQQQKIAPPVNAEAVQIKGNAPMAKPRAVPNAPAAAATSSKPANMPKTP